MSYAIGNLVGRFLMSYLIVLVINWIGARGRWSEAVRRTHQPLGWVAVCVVFVIGVAGFLMRGVTA